MDEKVGIAESDDLQAQRDLGLYSQRLQPLHDSPQISDDAAGHTSTWTYLLQAKAKRLMDLCWKVETLANAADIAKAGAA